MSTQDQKVAVITGASQGIGAGLVDAYRKLGYAVVATSRTIAAVRRRGRPHRPGRHRRPRHRRARDRRRRRAVRPHRHPGQQRRRLHRQAVHRLHRRTTTPPSIGVNLAGFFRITQLRHRADARPGRRPHRQHHHQPGRPRRLQRAVRAGLADQGRPAVRHQVAGHRVRHPRHPRQRRLAGHHQDPDAPRGDPRGPRRPAPGRPDGRDRATSSRRSSTSRTPRSSPARSCTSTAARAPVTDLQVRRPRHGRRPRRRPWRRRGASRRPSGVEIGRAPRAPGGCRPRPGSRSSLVKMLPMCLLTAFSVTTSRAAIAALERPSAISPSTSRSRAVSRPSGSSRSCRASSCDDDLGVHGGAAAGDPADRVDELAHVGDPVLEQVAEAARRRRRAAPGRTAARRAGTAPAPAGRAAGRAPRSPPAAPRR